MLYDTILLRSFVTICDTRSFTKAARLVNLSQSAVSLHIKRLEEQVGCRLFERDGYHLAVTADGEILLSYARRILALHGEIEKELGRKQPSGLVRLGAPEYFDPQTLASLLAQFARRYPAVRLEIEMGIGPDIAAQLAKGALDLAIVNRETGEGDGVVLRRERRVWAAAKEMVLDPRATVPLALFPPHCGWRRLAIEELDKAGRRWTLALQSAGVAGILAAVEASLAVSVFAESGLPSHLKAMGEAEGLPSLPDFEYVLRRKPEVCLAANRLAEVIVDFFQLAASLRHGSDASQKGLLDIRKNASRETLPDD